MCAADIQRANISQKNFAECFCTKQLCVSQAWQISDERTSIFKILSNGHDGWRILDTEGQISRNSQKKFTLFPPQKKWSASMESFTVQPSVTCGIHYFLNDRLCKKEVYTLWYITLKMSKYYQMSLTQQITFSLVVFDLHILTEIGYKTVPLRYTKKCLFIK